MACQALANRQYIHWITRINQPGLCIGEPPMWCHQWLAGLGAVLLVGCVAGGLWWRRRRWCQQTPTTTHQPHSAALSELVPGAPGAPGAPGQVALRMNATGFNSPADARWLFSSPSLQSTPGLPGRACLDLVTPPP